MNALIVILAVATISYQLWVHFVAVMHLKRMRDAGQLTTAQKFIGYPVLAMMGWEARVSEREQNGRPVFRVRVGPFAKRDDAAGSNGS